MSSEFTNLLSSVRGDDWKPPDVVLSIDPGETCGWARFINGTLTTHGEVVIPTFKDGRIEGVELWDLFNPVPRIVVIEGYRVYASKAKHHTWSALYTPKLIGYLECICQYYKTELQHPEYYLQMASSKQFCTDVKLKSWNCWPTGHRHAADAIRHGCYWLLFHGRSK